MQDRFFSRHIQNTPHTPNHSSTIVKKSATSESPKVLLSQIKDSLDTWTALANTGGALTTGANYLPPTGDMQRFSDQLHESEAAQKGYGTLVGLLLSIVAGLIWYIRRKNRSHQEIKKELNAWYNRFSIASQACQDIATVAFSFLPPVMSHFKRLISYVVGTIAGVGLVLVTRSSSTTSKSSALFTLGGSEGWSSYMYTGSSIGALVGGGLGAIIGLLIPLPFTMPACTALFAALGGLAGTLITAIGVPLSNKLIPSVNPSYRMNYAKTGALLGSTLGGIIGFIVGLCIPLPGAALAVASFGMGVGALVGSIAIAIAGPAITQKIDENEKSNWDYSTRYAGVLGNGIGTIVGVGLENLQTGAQQLAVNVGTLITSAIGFCYDLWTTRKNKAKSQINPTQEKKISPLPWSQRVNLFAAIGTASGSVIGFLVGGPLGMVIGGAIGAVVGSAIGLTAGNFLCKKITLFGDWLTKKIDSFCCEKSTHNLALTIDSQQQNVNHTTQKVYNTMNISNSSSPKAMAQNDGVTPGFARLTPKSEPLRLTHRQPVKHWDGELLNAFHPLSKSCPSFNKCVRI